MWTKLFQKLLGRTNPTPVPTGLIADPANIPVLQQPANDPTPARITLTTTRDILRFRRDDRLALPGSKVVTRNSVEMRVARIVQKPPYVICVYKGRRLAVRAENCGLYWTTVSEPIQ